VVLVVDTKHNRQAVSVFSIASLMRRAFNQHLIERISPYLAKGHSLEKSSPDDEALCNYGTIIETAA
jgi:IS5 family transposase